MLNGIDTAAAAAAAAAAALGLGAVGLDVGVDIACCLVCLQTTLSARRCIVVRLVASDLANSKQRPLI